MQVAGENGDRDRYTRVAILLHWTIAVLLITNIVIGLLHDTVLKGAMPLHEAIGLLVLALSLVRLGWRLAHRPPPLPATVARWEKGVAHAVHWIFYALMILIPLSGWIFTSASMKRQPLPFFGLFDVPYFPVPQDKAISHVWHDRHVVLAYMMIALLLLHAGAALKHRFLDRDRTLDRMLPVLPPVGPPMSEIAGGSG